MIHGRLRCYGEANATESTQFRFKGLDETFPIGKIGACRHMCQGKAKTSRFELRCWQNMKVISISGGHRMLPCFRGVVVW